MDDAEEYFLDYTKEQIQEIGEKKEGGGGEYKASKEEAMERLVWLANWFLKGVVTVEVWRKEVTAPTLHQHVTRRNFFTWAHTSDLAFLCVVYIQNYKRWQEEDKLVRKLGRNEVLTKTQKDELETMTAYGRDGVSSAKGGKKLAQLNYYIGKTFKEELENNKEFDEAFWKYHDEHCAPILREKEERRRLSLPDDDPQATAKKKQAEEEQMWGEYLAKDDDDSF